MIVTIDPGQQTGWATWSDAVELVACGLGDPTSEVVVGSLVVWIEDQVIYPRSKANPNDILKLAKNAAGWARDFERLGAQLNWIEPARWKGQLPKDVVHARMWSKLDPREQSAVNVGCRGLSATKRHNVLDAVAIGVWLRTRGKRS